MTNPDIIELATELKNAAAELEVCKEYLPNHEFRRTVLRRVMRLTLDFHNRLDQDTETEV